MIKLSSLKLNPNNPRFIKDDKFKKLCISLKEFPKMMDLRPIVIDKANGNLILGGNMRFRALREIGLKEIPEKWVKDAKDLTKAEKKRFIVADNIPYGGWDFEILSTHFDTEELINFGFSEIELGIFEPGTEEDQGRLDEKEPTVCPKCGHSWVK